MMVGLSEGIERYAEILIQVGVNIQPGQRLMIGYNNFLCPLESAPLIRQLVKKAYEAGASDVVVLWEDHETFQTQLQYAPLASLQSYPRWRVELQDQVAEAGGAFLALVSTNSKLFASLDPARRCAWFTATHEDLQGFFSRLIRNEVSWCVAGVPTQAWAQEVFPDLPKEQGIDKLWEVILRSGRAFESDPVQAWREHREQLDTRRRYLNSLKLRKLFYRAAGTDLTIELPDQHRWVSATSAQNSQGVPFCPNIPTEEVYTSPRRNGVNGVVQSTMPLFVQGQVIEDFRLRFMEGRIVEYRARIGQAALEQLIESNEGTHYLGEVALVPWGTQILQTGVLFKNTLYDENALSHFAIGRAFPICLEGGTEMSQEQLGQRGLNDCPTHVDFMIGSPDLEVDGETEDGALVPIFRNGCWV